MWAHAENEIGFIERFALAPDREKVLGELVPGSEDFYFFHALHYQNTRNAAKLADILAQWRKRFPDETQRRRVIENREALLGYDADPQATLTYLKEHLGIRHDHQQEVRDKKPDLPTTLDPQRIARNVFLADSLAHDGGLQGFTQEALAALVRDKATLPPHQRRALLQKLQRPDVPGLVELIAQDLQSKESRGFGEFAIHRALLPEQLDELVRLTATLALDGYRPLVFAKMRKLAPSADVNVEYDAAEREAWLDRLWAYAKTLPPAFNTEKAHILYRRLDHDRQKGVYDQALFLEYVKLPRAADYMNPKWLDSLRDRMPFCDFNADLSEALVGHHPIGDDQPLVREYFLHLFSQRAAAEPGRGASDYLQPYAQYVRDTWLRPVFAEAMIVNGIGNAESWASLLTPTAFQQLKERVDIEFPATNVPFLLPGDDVQFDVVVKNTPKLIVKIFELNTLNFFQTQHRQLNTDLNLDGLVANTEQTHTFDSGPFARTRQTFKFPELKGRRGAWVIEFIGGGRSSRALVRVGQWQVLQQTGPAGDLLLVLDEKNQPVPDAVAWLDGRKLTRDEKLGRIVVPFTNQPGTKPLIIGDAAGTFATLTQFEHHGEDYRLDAQFHMEREQLLARREATLAVRTALMLGGTHLAPELLTEPKLTITSTTHDGISTTREVKDLKLSAGSVLTHKLTVPERLASLSVTFSGKVEVLSAGGEKREVSASHTWTLNGMDKTEAVSDGHLSTFDGQRVFELLGKNGEPLADQQVMFTFKHREFARTQTVALRTDEKGRVMLGTLADIASVTAKCPNERQSTWALEDEEHTFSSVLHVKAGEPARVPASGNAVQASLLALRAGTFTADHRAAVTQRDGFLVIEGLAPGDYSLRLAGEPRSITIKVAAGEPMGGWLLGKHRQLEVKHTAPLHITGVQTDAEFITVKLANSSPFARVHVAASRFDAGRGIFGGLGGFTRFGAASGTPAKLPNLYSAGREIGDEYRYILDRRYAKAYPGNMLTRPGLLLNPWETRKTDLEELAQQAGEGASSTRGGAAGATTAAQAEAAKKQAPGAVGAAAETNLDFLAESAPVLWNLLPDKDGIVRIERKALGDRQQVQVYAEDLQNASWRSFTLPEAGTKFADQRLARSLDPAKPFTQRKEVTVLEAGRTLTLADILTSELETYDSLSGVHSLFTTLSGDANLAKFAFVLQWPKLTDAEKRAKFGEFACHELGFFLARKDKPFFDAVVRPYLANKKDKTFMDDFLLSRDLSGYLEPWAYGRLNVVERCLLAQRLEGEAPNAARHLRELWELIPPNPEEMDRLFETALRGRAMEAAAEGQGVTEMLRDEKRKAMKAMPELSAMSAPAPAPPASPAPMAAPADNFTAADGGRFAKGMGMGGAPRSAGSKRSLSVDELEKLGERFDMDADSLGLADARKDAAERERTLGRVVAGKELNIRGEMLSESAFVFFGDVAAREGRAAYRAMFRALGPTKEWAENNYYQLRIVEQDADLVTVNAFWRDYAAWVAGGAKGAFVSPNVAEASRNFTEMMLALAVLDLPFDAAKHVSKADGGQFTLTAGGPVIVYHKEIKPAANADAAQGQLLVSQSFFRQGDRYRQEGNEKFEKYVTEEFLTGAVFGANVVVTNPTSAPVKAVVLLQIPQGALPALGSKATDSRQVRLEPYTTQTFEYHFYFPSVPAKAGVKFAHFPVNVATTTGAAGAKPFEFNVVAKLTQVDKASWDYVSQYGSDAEVFAFLDQNNLESLDMERIAWRCRQSVDFYRKLTATLRAHHVWDDVIGTYALLHNDTATLREWLKHRDDFVGQCGPFLATKLVTLDPIERRSYEHLEYSPLVNQRAHRLGNEWRIANPSVLGEYTALLDILAHKPQLDAMDSMSVAYFLFLQDRVEEALAKFKAVDAGALPTRLQHDYFKCYAAFYENNLAEARGLAAKYADFPVPRWKTLFADVATQLDEIEGKATKPEKGDKPDREKQQAELAATEPAFDFKVENKSIALTWKNLGEVTLNYYLMDPEFSFSSNPFVSQDAGRFSIIKPSKTATQALPKDKDTLDVALPLEFAKANVLVEVIGAGQRKTQAYHANTLKLAVTENYGRLETRDSTTDKPLPKAYVKVYAKLKNGTVRFFKDGYTDLRGRFDYASLNGPEGQHAPEPVPYEAAPANGLDYQMLKPVELGEVQKLALLVLSDTNGATTREVNPPGQ